MNINERFYRETSAGGFTRLDGTVQFFQRVNALLRPDMIVLDLGAGRGAFMDDDSLYRRNLQYFKGKVSRIIGIDVDPVVLENTALDEARHYDGSKLPLDDAIIDLIISDHTFEHLPDPSTSALEMSRVLKPGGWICARTPHFYSALAMFSALTPNRMHKRALGSIQPDRKMEDIFPTVYGLNTIRALRKHFPNFNNYSYTWSPEPSYHFNNSAIYKMYQIYQYLKYPIMGGEVLLAFLQKLLD